MIFLPFWRVIPCTQKPFRERCDGFNLCRLLQKSDPDKHNRHIYMNRSPKANQGTNTLAISSRWGLNSEKRAEMKERAGRDCWLTSVINLYTRKEKPGPAKPSHTCPPRQSLKDFCQHHLALSTVCWKKLYTSFFFSLVITSVVSCNDWDPTHSNSTCFWYLLA